MYRTKNGRLPLRAGLLTSQIRYPGDWLLWGVERVRKGGRTGQSFPLHILSDKILLSREPHNTGSGYVIFMGGFIGSHTHNLRTYYCAVVPPEIWMTSLDRQSPVCLFCISSFIIFRCSFLLLSLIRHLLMSWLAKWKFVKESWKKKRRSEKNIRYKLTKAFASWLVSFLGLYTWYLLVNTRPACLASLLPLWSFSHLSLPPWLPPSLPSPTVFLSVSCLESQPLGQPRARKFVSGSAVEREATCSGGSEASALTWGLSLTVDPPLLFQARPLWSDDRPGNMQRAERCSLFRDTGSWWRLLV